MKLSFGNELEYGTDRLEIHKDAIENGQRVLIVDDVLATGGTAAAVARLVEKLGGRIAGYGFVIELDFLRGREKFVTTTLLTSPLLMSSATRRARVKAFAKLNLTLEVLGRRSDGYHDLRSISNDLAVR